MIIDTSNWSVLDWTIVIITIAYIVWYGATLACENYYRKPAHKSKTDDQDSDQGIESSDISNP